jgi:four helix bundle protein
MAIRDFRKLVAWQLSYELKCEAWVVTAAALAARGFKLSDQLMDASASAPRIIAEGFGRFRSREMAYFLSIARASLMETENHLIDARDRGYLAEREHRRLTNLAHAARRATTKLMRYHQRRGRQE